MLACREVEWRPASFSVFGRRGTLVWGVVRVVEWVDTVPSSKIDCLWFQLPVPASKLQCLCPTLYAKGRVDPWLWSSLVVCILIVRSRVALIVRNAG